MRCHLDEWLLLLRHETRDVSIYVVCYIQAHLTTNSARGLSLFYGHPARHRLRSTRLEWQKTSSVRPSLTAYMCLSSQLRLAWSGYKLIWCDLMKLYIHIIPFSVAMQNLRLWPETRERARSPSPACAIVQTEAFTDTYSHNLAFPRIQEETITVVGHTYLFDEQNDLLTSLGEFSRLVLSFPIFHGSFALRAGSKTAPCILVPGISNLPFPSPFPRHIPRSIFFCARLNILHCTYGYYCYK